MTALNPAVGAALIEHWDTMHRVAAAVLGDAGLIDHVEDVIQDVGVELMTNPPTRIGNWEAFLVTVTHRRAIDLIRSAAVRRRSDADIDLDAFESTKNHILEFEENYDLLRGVSDAVDAFNTLPPDLHDVGHQYWFLHRTQQEIADSLGVTQARVSQILKTARDEIKRKMSNRGGAS